MELNQPVSHMDVVTKSSMTGFKGFLYYKSTKVHGLKAFKYWKYKSMQIFPALKCFSYLPILNGCLMNLWY